MSKKIFMWLVAVVSVGVLVGTCMLPLWILMAYQAAKNAVPAAVQPVEQQVLRELLEPTLLGIPLIEDLERASVSTLRRLNSYCTRQFVADFAHLAKAWEGIKAQRGGFLAIGASSSISPELLGMSRRADSRNTRATLYTLRFERGSAYLGIVVVRHQGRWLVDSAHLYTEKPSEPSVLEKGSSTVK